MTKKEFIETSLTTAIVDANANIKTLTYINPELNDDEYIDIEYPNGYIRRIDISCCSNLCIMEIVANYLLKH